MGVKLHVELVRDEAALVIQDPEKRLPENRQSRRLSELNYHHSHKRVLDIVVMETRKDIGAAVLEISRYGRRWAPLLLLDNAGHGVERCSADDDAN